MAKIVSKPDAGTPIGDVEIKGETKPVQLSQPMQAFFDDLEQTLNDNLLGEVVQLTSYTVAGVPSASSFTGGEIFVTDETGGAVPAFSDGTNWRRVTDRTIIS